MCYVTVFQVLQCRQKGHLMFKTDINIISVIFINDSIVANIDLDGGLTFVEGVSSKARQKVVDELNEKGIIFHETGQ